MNVKLTKDLEDTHREKVPLNKTPTFSRSMNMHMWVVGTSNQLFLPGSYVKTKTNSNFAVNLPEMLKEATIHFCLCD